MDLNDEISSLYEGSPSWRWDFVKVLVQENRKPSRLAEKPIVDAYRFLKRWMNASEVDRYLLKRDYPDVFSAYVLFANPHSEKWVISGLVKNMDTDSSIDGYISDIMLGMDRLGRLLFLYYWHNDKFEERYGKQDMIQLEGNLRNVFKNIGDLVLFMKQKSVEATSSFRDTEPKLKDVLV